MAKLHKADSDCTIVIGSTPRQSRAASYAPHSRGNGQAEARTGCLRHTTHGTGRGVRTRRVQRQPRCMLTRQTRRPQCRRASSAGCTARLQRRETRLTRRPSRGRRTARYRADGPRLRAACARLQGGSGRGLELGGRLC